MEREREEKVAPRELDEATLRNLVDAAFDALVITHAGKIVFANRSFVEMYGGSRDEIIGGNVIDFVAPESRDFVIAQMQRPSESRYEAVGVRRDGTRIDVEICAHSATYEGRPVRITAIRYITDRKLAEQALRRSESRLRGLIERIGDIIIVLRHGAVVFANPAALTYLGYADLATIIGTNALDFVHPGDRSSVLALWSEGRAEALLTARLVRRDGSISVVEIAATEVHEFDGGPANVLLARDISERQRIEARLVEVDLLSSMGMLAAGIAHEINNPLAYVTLNLNTMARKIAALRAANDEHDRELSATLYRDVEELLAETTSGAERVRQIVRDVRVFARGRTDARGDTDARSAIDLPQVLDATIQLALNSIRHRARLVRQYERVPLVEADQARLGQLFLNVLINALQAIDESDDNRPAEIRVRTGTAANGAAFVEISDTGCGIPDDLLGRIFEPFFTTKPPGIGTGLGLPICRSIATSLGGTVDIESTLGQGTTCRVTLPASSAAPADVTDRAPPQPASTAVRLRVLVVDDEPALLRSLGEELGEAHDVTCTSSGAEAIALLLGESFDVVLCDVMMPLTSGIDVFRALQRDRPGLEQRIVFMTGGAFTPAAGEFLASVPNRKLEKPFTFDDLERVLADAARGSSHQG
ncbi:MAG TPA: PAS domain S-box protein [Kofleriaceae bacterium]